MSYQTYLIVYAIIAAMFLIATIIINVKKKKESGEETIDIMKYLLSYTDKFVAIAEQVMASMDVSETDYTKEQLEENKKLLLNEMIDIIVTSSDELGIDVGILKDIPDEILANIIYKLIETYLPTTYVPEAFNETPTVTEEPKEETPIEEDITPKEDKEVTSTLETFYDE